MAIVSGAFSCFLRNLSVWNKCIIYEWSSLIQI